METRSYFDTLQEEIVYGPVESRRLGKSIGINLFPGKSKVCSLNCRYCFFRTNSISSPEEGYIRADDVIRALDKYMTGPLYDSEYKESVYLTFSGNGEPTLHPDFAEIA
jgi:wyosine [tRNA(Phe)-imidazoG37] synthetase (radical SAM superfamily)